MPAHGAHSAMDILDLWKYAVSLRPGTCPTPAIQAMILHDVLSSAAISAFTFSYAKVAA